MKKNIVEGDEIIAKIFFKEKIHEIQLSLKNNEEIYKEVKDIGCSEKISNYLDGEEITPDCKINEDKLTDHQKMVFDEVREINYGETRTYGEISDALPKKSSPRAIGQALSKNPFPLIVPCHRVVKKNGLGGYRYGKEIKKELLTLEELHP